MVVASMKFAEAAGRSSMVIATARSGLLAARQQGNSAAAKNKMKNVRVSFKAPPLTDHRNRLHYLERRVMLYQPFCRSKKITLGFYENTIAWQWENRFSRGASRS